MTAYNSSQSGFWDEVATWGGGGFPVSGDTATILGTHTVTIRGNVTVGTNAGITVDAIIINAGGKLAWDTNPTNDYTLKLRGRVSILYGGEWQIGTEANPILATRTVTIDIGETYEHAVRVLGTLRVHGSPSYHMADATKQRTQLAANSAAAATQIIVQDAVDWVAGDVLWLATGGDKLQAPTGNEKVTIASKADPYTYNVSALVYNHFGGSTYGDMVVHASRNVTFTGQGATQGFSLTSTGATANIPTFDLNWCKFKYGGMVGSLYVIYGSIVTATIRWGLSNVTIRNIVIEDPGNVSTLTSGITFYYAPIEPDPDFSHLDEIHVYGFPISINFSSLRGIARMGHVSSIKTTTNGIDLGGDGLMIKSFWFTGPVPLGIACMPLNISSSCTIQIDSIKIHNAYKGLSAAGGNDEYASPAHWHVKNGEIYHVIGGTTSWGIYMTGVSYLPVLEVDNVDFYDNQRGAIEVAMAHQIIYLRNSKINACGFGLRFASGGSMLRLSNCEFGVDARNTTYNIWLEDAAWNNQSWRKIFEKCKFRIPTALPAGGYDWFTERLRWAIYQSDMTDWRDACEVPAKSTYEFIDCQLLDASSVDQWSTVFPNTNILGIVGGSSQIHKTHQTNEASGYIDGTFQRKLLPFMGLTRTHITEACPIRIPVASGQTVTAKLSFKKNVSQISSDLPKLHLFGCGISTEDTMQNVQNTWDELVVSGVAQNNGVVELWVSCHGIQDYQESNPARTPTTDINWAYPIDPGGVSASTGTYNLILYCDGLDITIA